MYILQRLRLLVKWENQKNIVAAAEVPSADGAPQKYLAYIDKYAESWYGLFGKVCTDVCIVQNCPLRKRNQSHSFFGIAAELSSFHPASGIKMTKCVG